VVKNKRNQRVSSEIENFWDIQNLYFEVFELPRILNGDMKNNKVFHPMVIKDFQVVQFFRIGDIHMEKQRSFPFLKIRKILRKQEILKVFRIASDENCIKI